MPIRKIEQITINGSNKIWNGYIYNLSYEPSLGDNPSTLTVNIISEDGEYFIEESDLQTTSPHTIKIGESFNLKMYPVSYNKQSSSSGRLLEVKYVDTSIILDKKIVVLIGRQGYATDGGIYIPVGRIKMSSITANKYLPSDQQYETIDLSSNPNVDNLGCDINDVIYSFQDLCSAISRAGIAFGGDSSSIISSINSKYYKSWSGTLRDVLNNWCNDFGLGWYWENESINLVDLTTRINVKTDQIEGYCKESLTESVSIENTAGRVAVSFFGKECVSSTSTSGTYRTFLFTPVELARDFKFSKDEINSIKAARFNSYEFYLTYHLFKSFNSSLSWEIIFGGTENPGAVEESERKGLYETIKTQISSIPDYNKQTIYIANFNDDWVKKWYEYDNAIGSMVSDYFYEIFLDEAAFNAYSFDGGVSTYDANMLLEQTPFANLIRPNKTTESQTLKSIFPGLSAYKDGIFAISKAENYYKWSHSKEDTDLELEALADKIIKTKVVPPDKLKEALSKTYSIKYGQNGELSIYIVGNWRYLDYVKDLVENQILLPEETNVRTSLPIKGKYTLTSTSHSPKQQSFIRTQDFNESNVIKIDMQASDLNEEDVNLAGSAAVAHQLFSADTSFSVTEPSKTKELVFPFVDFPNGYKPTIKDGLISVTFRWDDKGVRSVYRYGNSLFKLKNPDIVRNKLAMSRSIKGYKLL